jgi:murein DD-endopeptidase MepM/ murein hydrolase activator NlpD
MLAMLGPGEIMKSALNGSGLFAVVFVLLCIAAGIFVAPKFESTAPAIESEAALSIGSEGAVLEVLLRDLDTGLRSFQARLVHVGGGKVVQEEQFSGSLLSGGVAGVATTFAIELDPKELQLGEGRATLILTTRDWSWREAGQGNRSEISIPLTIDTIAPQISPPGGLIYVYRGGAAVADYQVGESTESDGVRVGDRFYPGYPDPGSEASKGRRIAFFAVPVDAPSKPKVMIEAVDHAGNRSQVPLRARVFERRFPEERLNLSERFFERVIPPLAEKLGVEAESNVAAFQHINRIVRAENETRIQQLIEGSASERYWTGAFGQLRNSKVMSRFAEQRRYFHGEDEISQATHYGFDLASRAGADITAANAGKVIFADDLGIYGGCVLVDHGMGLTTLYAHLSVINVEPGQMVEKGEAMGSSGTTGLAGGDHLHFAVMIGGTYVDPLEWWDGRWIESHVEVRFPKSAR